MIFELLKEIENNVNGVLSVLPKNAIDIIQTGKFFISSVANAEYIHKGASAANDEFPNVPYIVGKTKGDKAIIHMFELDIDMVNEGGIYFSTVDHYHRIENLSYRKRMEIPRDSLIYGDPVHAEWWRLIADMDEDFNKFVIYEIRAKVLYLDKTIKENQIVGYYYEYADFIGE